LKNNLSRYVRAVRNGEEVVVLDRDTPVARLVPYRPAAGRVAAGKRKAPAAVPHERIDELVRRGSIGHRGDPDDAVAWADGLTVAKAPKDAPALSEVLLRMRDEEPW
jgi:antitoxin (DNA-binding transcriptional repressor) of toxin-antitoxin stability system